jgi:hypothetical protein
MLADGDRTSLASVFLSALGALAPFLPASNLPKVFDGLAKLPLKVEHLNYSWR